jgi:hypothetical protein
MAQRDPIQQAYKKMTAAAELLAQACAVRSFGEQLLIEKAKANDEVARLIDEYRREAEEVSRMLDRVLKQNGHRKNGHKKS